MGSVADKQKTNRLRKLQDEHFRFVDDAMAENNKLTSSQLFNLFKEKYPEVSISISTIKRARRELAGVGSQAYQILYHDC